MITVKLNNAPEYTALSYLWGSNLSRHAVTINGIGVTIGDGLFKALSTLRSPDSELLLWADAICINQEDNREKEKQIALMSDIYSLADNVAVIMGQDSERSEAGMRYLQCLADPTSPLHIANWKHCSLDELQDSLSYILKCLWFTRIWTVQEAALARHTTLVYGVHRVSWQVDTDTMRAFVFRIKSMALSPSFRLTENDIYTVDWSSLLKVLETQLRQAARRAGVPVYRDHLDVAYDFRDRKCYDPRDKYYAIFGIIENDAGGRLMVAPDYNMTVEELHERFIQDVWRKWEGLRPHAQLRDVRETYEAYTERMGFAI